MNKNEICSNQFFYLENLFKKICMSSRNVKLTLNPTAAVNFIYGKISNILCASENVR